MSEHTWKRRVNGERIRVTNVSGYGYGKERVLIDAYDYCENCGVSRPMAEHMGWTECREAS